MARQALNPKTIRKMLLNELANIAALRAAPDSTADDIRSCAFWTPRLQAEVNEMDRRIARQKAETQAGFWGGTYHVAKLVWPAHFRVPKAKRK